MTYEELADRFFFPPGIMESELLRYASYRKGKSFHDILIAYKTVHERRTRGIGVLESSQKMAQEFVVELEKIITLIRPELN